MTAAKTTKRGDRLIQDDVHDPYAESKKHPAGTVCPDCDAIVVAGRWTRGPRPDASSAVVCPACRRIRDDLPAGVVRLQGPFYEAHADEIRGLVGHEAAAAEAEHVLQRIMSTKESDGVVEIATTDPHLARRIGKAVARAYDGSLEMKSGVNEVLLRVVWER